MIIEREVFVYLFYVCGRMWPLFRENVWACFGRFIILPGLAIGIFESLPLYAVFIYMMDILFRIVLSKFEFNISCRLIFNSVETFNLSVRS